MSQKQHIALESLLGGATITTAAKEAGVDRTTVHRWLRSDIEFQAAWNGRRAEMRASASARLEQLADSAINVLERAMEEGDRRLAFSLLKGLGFLTGTAIPLGSDDPEALRMEASIAASEAAMAERERQFLELMGSSRYPALGFPNDET